jgi:uroporphyrinogen decarboxylase
MRQAGRYLPEYRALRSVHPFAEMIRTPELAAQATLLPVHAFQVDAAILFADILTLQAEMGLRLHYSEERGPVILNPVRSMSDVRRLADVQPDTSMSYTLDSVRMARSELDGLVPLIGFVGGPFTLACYAIEGCHKPGFPTALRFASEQPHAMRLLLSKLSSSAGRLLEAQAAAGAQAVQIFDTWAGLLDKAQFVDLALPYAAEIIRRVQDAGHVLPTIYYGARYPELGLRTGCNVIGIDSTVSLESALAAGNKHAVQGNLDPRLLADPARTPDRAAIAILEKSSGKPGHIFNVGRGLFKNTLPDNVRRLVELVHKHSALMIEDAYEREDKGNTDSGARKPIRA